MNDFIIDTLKRQGAFAALLLLISWLLYNKMERLEIRIQNCETEKFNLITQNNERSNTVIANNTIALDRNTESNERLIELYPVIRPKKRLTPLTARQGINKE